MQHIDEQQKPLARIVVYTNLKTQEGIAKWISQQSKDYKTNLVNGVANAILARGSELEKYPSSSAVLSSCVTS